MYTSSTRNKRVMVEAVEVTITKTKPTLKLRRFKVLMKIPDQKKYHASIINGVQNILNEFGENYTGYGLYI